MACSHPWRCQLVSKTRWRSCNHTCWERKWQWHCARALPQSSWPQPRRWRTHPTIVTTNNPQITTNDDDSSSSSSSTWYQQPLQAEPHVWAVLGPEVPNIVLASAMLRAHLFSIVDCDMGTAKDDPSYARGVWRIPHAKSRTSFVLRCTGKVCLRTSFEPFLIHFGGEGTSSLHPVRASLRVP